MLQYLSKSILLLFVAVAICCCIYPLLLWAIAQTFFPFQANGSMIAGPDGKIAGSSLIAQSFTKDEYFHPRPSACSYDASASSSSSLAVSNYALRDRVARSIGPIVQYEDGKPVGPDVERWFKTEPHLLAKWASLHAALAAGWIASDPEHKKVVDEWAKTHPGDFFQSFAEENPAQAPQGFDIQSMLFMMWREAHPEVKLQDVPGDFVTTSASGLDPHITLQNAEFQLDRVAAAWSKKLKADPKQLRDEIQKLLFKHCSSPLGGLAGESYINVLQINLELHKSFAGGSAVSANKIT